MSPSNVVPLAMSQTKDDLVRHLNMSMETYDIMSKETDSVYRWLVSEKCHRKKNCKEVPPYDWSDMAERSKDEAMKLIVQNGTEETSYYWNLASPTSDCPNWIARWFLYHKFRYRDGRSRNQRAEPKQTVRYDPVAPSRHHHGSHPELSHSHHAHHRQHRGETSCCNSSYYRNASMNAGDGQEYDSSMTVPSQLGSEYATYSTSQPYASPSSSYSIYNSLPSYTAYASSVAQDNGQTKPYDPVRDCQ